MSTDHATITFPYMAYMGRYADVTIRLGSLRGSEGSPARVKVSLNGRSYPEFDVNSSFGVRTFSLDTRETPNPYLDPAHIQLDIESSTIERTDGTNVGVAIDSVELLSRRDLRDVLMVTFAWVVSVLAVGVVALRRLTVRWAGVFMGATLATLAVSTFTYAVRPFPPAYEAVLVGLAWFVGVMVAPARHPAWGIALGLVGLWVALAGRLLNDWQMDDAYISYRYAWNLVHGHGLVYNPGEAPVEGYTNFLWTLVAAVVIALGFPPGGVMLTLIVACSIGVLGLVYLLATRALGHISAGSEMLAFVCVVLLAVDASFVTYGVKGSGIEAVPFSFLALLGIVLLWWRDDGMSRWYLVGGGLALALASLMRPEGMGIALIVIGVKAWQARSNLGEMVSTVGAIVAPLAVLVVPYQIWRITYYGYLFPNTFYAKTGTSAAILERGWEYTWAFVLDHWLVVALALVGGLFLLIRRGGIPGVVWGLYAVTALYSLYIVSVGGDHYPAGRFFVPLVAPLAVLAVVALGGLIARLGQSERVRLALVGVVLLGVVAYVVSAIQLEDGNGALAKRTNRDTNFVNIWGSMGLWLRDNTPADTLAASPVAGAIAYYGQRNVVDMLGINDLYIGHKEIDDMGSGLAGHEKQDPAYVLDRKPLYILPYPDYFDPLESRF
ncbi:MAG: hypothetical protein ABIQ44_07710, partial [Chloroflexia bacterium]